MKIKYKFIGKIVLISLFLISALSLPAFGEVKTKSIDLDEIKKNPEAYICFNDVPFVKSEIVYPIIYSLDPNNREKQFIEGRNANTWEKTDAKAYSSNTKQKYSYQYGFDCRATGEMFPPELASSEGYLNHYEKIIYIYYNQREIHCYDLVNKEETTIFTMPEDKDGIIIDMFMHINENGDIAFMYGHDKYTENYDSYHVETGILSDGVSEAVPIPFDDYHVGTGILRAGKSEAVFIPFTEPLAINNSCVIYSAAGEESTLRRDAFYQRTNFPRKIYILNDGSIININNELNGVFNYSTMIFSDNGRYYLDTTSLEIKDKKGIQYLRLFDLSKQKLIFNSKVNINFKEGIESDYPSLNSLMIANNGEYIISNTSSEYYKILTGYKEEITNPQTSDMWYFNELVAVAVILFFIIIRLVKKRYIQF